eukprot:TRINITY_DN2503_c0_g1_i1.p1 TRINITY_DN2503_c0_g1~~TRINITY_DN2503_c0_g1_i1.p1  ORF type:complete len:126 (-),score=34.40 TRINITY_DN2503_c0_g1_i1:25-360(-)
MLLWSGCRLRRNEAKLPNCFTFPKTLLRTRNFSDQVTKVSREQLHYIAGLSKIKISEKEEEKLCQDLSNILSYFNEIKSLDMSGVNPLITILEDVELPMSCLLYTSPSPRD